MRLVPMNEIAGRLGEFEAYRGQEIVVHCHHGGRSERVANWLRGQGFLKGAHDVGRDRSLGRRNRPQRAAVLND